MQDQQVRLEALARDLADAWREGRAIPLPSAGHGATTRAEAYAVQDRVAALIGGKVVSWKVGATVRPVQLMDGHDGALPGCRSTDPRRSAPAAGRHAHP